ncbi:MAG: hypothetical protein KJ676_00965 [Alphaproteobacteria bacterium]|nr:hypothetical protein [Alphaproteobacteria bacterium]MBU1527361.1 hypothetical protein [Alphaproteobacteria bacterium]MBU2116060.1 hypothetical protein [Alphaproteobacteria bacterium]MBU2352361.1 hypothetical protein [Alphaproteobacteria bacterium]MBU2382904.1 hypothetical protein [Alphaproteobacteria bacterium]
MKLLGLMILGACIAAPGMAKAQEEVLTTEPAAATAAGTPAWRTLSRTSSSIYLVDVGTMTEADGMKTARMARTLRSPPTPRDREHAIETYQFRCAANQWRVVRTEEYGADGGEVDAWDEADAPWLDVPPETNMAFLKAVVCDGEVPTARPWARLDDFLASPRT